MLPELNHFIELIKSGGVVAFPTETVYGLGADAWNPSAIKKVFDLKGRPADNPLIVHISELNQLRDFVEDVPEQASLLMQSFWPGPITFVLKKKAKVLDVITAGLDTVAIRMPDHPLALKFITDSGPLVAPSANVSGGPSPTKAHHVKADFGDSFPVIDGGATKIGLESTVLDVSGDVPVILRPGKIGKAEIENILKSKIEVSDENNIKPKSPGQKYSHYKPQANVRYGKIADIEDSALYLVQNKDFPEAENVINYSGNLELLSKELYDRFRQADIDGYSAVFIEEINAAIQEKYTSLYSALMNRIRKAVS